jgi:nucleoside-diphosphate-sugar epimerase
MKIFILGVDGFIGHSLAHRILTTTDWEIVGLDRFQGRVSPLFDYANFSFRRSSPNPAGCPSYRRVAVDPACLNASD